MILHIYDLNKGLVGLNGVLQRLNMGAFHAGVQVYGKEYAFSGSIDEDESFDCCGIMCHLPKEHDVHIYRDSIVLGRTALSEEQVEALLDRISSFWPSRSYDMLRRNCCHFAEYFSRCLGMRSFPRTLASLSAKMAAVADVFGSVRDTVWGAEDKEAPWEVENPQELLAALRRRAPCGRIAEESTVETEDVEHLQVASLGAPQWTTTKPQDPAAARQLSTTATLVSVCRSASMGWPPAVGGMVVTSPPLVRCLTF